MPLEEFNEPWWIQHNGAVMLKGLNSNDGHGKYRKNESSRWEMHTTDKLGKFLISIKAQLCTEKPIYCQQSNDKTVEIV